MIKFLKRIFSLGKKTRSIEERVKALEEFNISVATAVSDQYKIITNLTKTQYYLLNQVVQNEERIKKIEQRKSLNSLDLKRDDDGFIN